MRRHKTRKILGLVLMGIGAGIIIYFVPVWLWYIVLVGLILAIIYILIRIYT